MGTRTHGHHQLHTHGDAVFAYLEANFSFQLVKPSHLYILLLHFLIGFAFYGIALKSDPILALALFLTSVTPTASVAPAIVSFLGGKVEYVTFSVILTNCAMAVVLPFLLPHLVELEAEIPVADILVPTMQIVIAPLLGVLLLRKYWPSAASGILRFKSISFYFFMLNVYIATSKATYFVRFEAPPEAYTQVAWIGAGSLAICILSFGLGRWLGRPDLKEEASQSLGRKNTMFTVWLSLTYLNPMTALGPMFYIIWHNTYSSFQFFRTKK